MKKSVFIFISLNFITQLVYSQSRKEISKQLKSNIIEERIEAISETLDEEEVDLTTLFDELFHYLEHPINLNHTSVEELKQLNLLNDFQISNLLRHINNRGKLIVIYELQSVEGFDLNTIKNILPFIKVSDNFNTPQVSLKEILEKGNHELFLRYSRILEEQEGYSPIDPEELEKSPNKRYLGSPDRLYMRYRFKYGNNVSFGITGEKDAGEEFFKGSQQYGFDFYSAHLFLRDMGKFKHIAIGDYQVEVGQGLTIWSGRRIRKTAFTLDTKRNPLLLKPYTSVDENNFMRGLASTLNLGKFQFTTFLSRKNIDANVQQQTIEDPFGDGEIMTDEVVFTSFQVSGLHRTPSELANKNALGETVFGGNLSYVYKTLNIGIAASHISWDGEFNRRLNTYNQFDFNGNRNLSIGLNYNFVYRNFNFYGEGARSSSGGLAMISGALITLDPNMTVSVLYRNYSRDYHALYANGFGHTSRTINEKGLYIGFEARPSKTIILNGYVDRFENPWLRTGITSPSAGNDLLGQFTYKPNKKLEIYVRYRNLNAVKNGNIDVFEDFTSGGVESYTFSGTGIDPIVDTKKQQLRYNLKFRINDMISIQNRVEFSRFNEPGKEISNGMIIYQDINYKPLGKPFSFVGRIALFDTDDWNTRIYAYENDVLYAFSVPPYYGRGMRTYVVFRYRIVRNVDLWLRYAQTYYTDRTTIGSGKETIQGQTRTEVRAQLRIRLN
jgi:hypothetical protein